VVAGLFVGLGFWWSRAGEARRRIVDPWACGYVTASATPRFTAHHFYGALKPGQATGSSGTPEPEPERDPQAPPPAPTAKPSAS
jgi:hypothetical protein